MKFISPNSLSKTLSGGTFLANSLYAQPLIIRDGTYVFSQAAMIYSFGNVRLSIYSDNNDYPGSLLLDAGIPTSVTPISSTSNLLPSLVQNFTLGSFTLQVGKYWIVCIADSPVGSASYLASSNDESITLADNMGQGWDLQTQEAITGLITPFNFSFAFPSTFPVGAINIENQNFLPWVSLGVQSFTASTGGSGYSGMSGFSGFGGPGSSGYSGFSGSSGFSGQSDTDRWWALVVSSLIT